MLEKELEAKFKKRVEKHGAKVWKFVSPGKAGAPDRIILIPKGKCIFAEIKRPNEKPRKLQNHIMRNLRNLGFDVWVIDAENAIGEFCDCYFND